MTMLSRDRERRRMYNKSKLGSAKAQLRIVSQSYGDMVRTFLFQVGGQLLTLAKWVLF